MVAGARLKGRQVVGGEPSISVDPLADIFVAGAPVFGLADPLGCSNDGIVQSAPRSPVPHTSPMWLSLRSSLPGIASPAASPSARSRGAAASVR